MKKIVSLILLFMLVGSVWGQQMNYVSLTKWNLKHMHKYKYTKYKSKISVYAMKHIYDTMMSNGMSEKEFEYEIRVNLVEGGGSIYCVSSTNALGFSQMLRSTHKYVWVTLLHQPRKTLDHQKLFDPLYAFQIKHTYLKSFTTTNMPYRKLAKQLIKKYGVEHFTSMAYKEGPSGAVGKAKRNPMNVQKRAHIYAHKVNSSKFRKMAKRIIENIKTTPLIESKIIPFDRRRWEKLQKIPKDIKVYKAKALMTGRNKTIRIRYNRKKKIWQTNDKYHTTITNDDIQWVETNIGDY